MLSRAQVWPRQFLVVYNNLTTEFEAPNYSFPTARGKLLDTNAAGDSDYFATAKLRIRVQLDLIDLIDYPCKICVECAQSDTVLRGNS